MTSRRAKDRNKLKKQPSPANRRLAREEAEAAALAEIERDARKRREKSARLRKLRLGQDSET